MEDLQHQGKYEQVEEMNRQVLAGYEKALGADHPNTLTSVYSLAHLLSEINRHEALELYERAVIGYIKALGAEHPTTIACFGFKAQSKLKYIHMYPETGRIARAPGGGTLGLEQGALGADFTALGGLFGSRSETIATKAGNCPVRLTEIWIQTKRPRPGMMAAMQPANRHAKDPGSQLTGRGIVSSPRVVAKVDESGHKA